MPLRIPLDALNHNHHNVGQLFGASEQKERQLKEGVKCMRALAFKFGVNTKKQRQAKLWHRAATLLTAFVVMGAGLTQLAQAAPGDYQWQQAGVVGMIGDNLDWYSIASSSNGSKLVGVVGGASSSGYIYTSIDSGVTWVEQTAAGSRHWYSVASSSDGSKLAAVDNGGYIYTSADSGATWAERSSAGLRSWTSVSTSADGTRLAAVAGFGSSIYISADSGVSWTEGEATSSYYWYSIASSNDGTKLVAGTDIGFIHTSTDSGASWTERFDAPGGFYTVASSDDGTKLVAGAYGGYIYTSADSGATWTEQTAAGSRDWWSVDSSADGTKLVAAAWGGYIYTSTDSGATWTEQTAAGPRNWASIASSSDGSKLAASAYGGSIYLATTEGLATATIAMASLPTGNKDATAAPAVATASLAATSMACYTLTPGSVSTLGPDSLVVPESGVSLLGGVAFSLDCTSTGGTADTSITLGTSYTDVSKLRVYKRSGTGPLVDITKQVTIQNESGKTVVRYTLTDGSTWDEDGTANGTIVDPIYFGVVAGASATVPSTPAAGGPLAKTGMSVWAVAARGLVIVAAGVTLSLKTFRRERVNFSR